MAASQASFPPLIYLLVTNLGWRNAWVILGILIWSILVIPSLVLVRRSPESVGLLPDGDLSKYETNENKVETKEYDKE